MIAALFVETNGCYYGLPGVDPYDKNRDAKTYYGPWSVVAHPPCNRWCKYARVNQTRYGHKVGDDDGCFVHALSCVRLLGGVLEHPSQSIAFDRFGLGRPKRGQGWTKADDGIGWMCEVYQGRYGHRAAKPTWLYAVGCELPVLDHSPIRTGISCTPKTGVRSLPQNERLATPVPFRDMLIDMAISVYLKGIKNG